MKEMRSRFDGWFDRSHALRRLAGDIAGLRASHAGPFVSTGVKNFPFNFLANGVPGESYHLPRQGQDHKTILPFWKLGSITGDDVLHGFGETDQPLKGLSLLFDPVVDFSLAAHMFSNGVLPANPIVMVLTDYYPIDHSTMRWSEILNGNDWAEWETASYNNPANWVQTMFYLKWALLDVNAETPPRPSDVEPENPALELIVKNDILLWNFLPMFRGGTEPGGIKGLPSGDGYKLICIEWMMRFAEAVNASVVLLCFNQELGMQTNDSRTRTVHDYSVPNPPAGWYTPDIGVLTRKLDLVFASSPPRVRDP